MALQTPELVMLGLGVLDDKAPHDTLPPVADGVHLRWGFPRERGFPPYGFYLFRRAHIERWFRLKEPLPTGPGFATDGPKLRAIFTDAPPDLVLGDERFIIEMVGDRALPEAPPPYALPHTREFEIRFLWQIPNSPEQGTSVYAMELDLEFRRPAAVTVTALFDGEPILKRDIRGGGVPGEQTVRLEAGAMTEVRITPGAVALTGLRVLPVMYRAAEGWQEIPSFPYPLDLPLEPGLTLDENRQRARSRVHFQRPADTEALRDRFAGPGSDLPASGQVTLTRGSAIVRGVPDAHGIGTDWGRELQGAVLETDAGGPYTILSVVASDRLVLSRPPEITQPSATVSYRIREDTFGQLHDYLSLLRQGDQQQDPMANRALPAPLYLEGQIRVQAGDPPSLVRRVGGTQWSGELSGMTLTPVEYEAGTVTVEHGSPAVRDDGNTADWDESLVGRRWQLAGQTALYIIEAVDDAGQTLTLDRAYLGPSESGKTYRIYQDLSYRIEQVNGPDEMLLAQPFVAEGDGPWSYALC
jgi:hypothetical protein